MMIQGSNPSSMLSGLESGGAVPSVNPTEDGNTAAFTASLMQQLALLQGNPAHNAAIDADVLANLPSAAALTEGSIAGQDVQNFAALFGKALPMAKKIDQDIDLDDTLNALSDVLQYLQGLGTDSANPAIGQSATDGAVVVQDNLAGMASASEQTLDPSAVSNIAQPVAEEVSGAASSAVGDGELSALKKAMPSGADGRHDVFAFAQAGDDKQPLALGGEMADALLSQDNASRDAGQEKQAAPKNAEDDLAVLANPAKNLEIDKNPSRMAADIAQLNQAVNAEKKVEVPAMTRHLTHPEWNKELGEKLIWMHKQAIPSAELRLNPQHLGPISIKVDVNQDQATVAFTAQHAGVKEAIEAAIPKLREMLSGQQLNLADVNVSQQQSEQRQPSDFFKMASERGHGSNAGQNDEAENPANQPAIDIVDEIESGRALASNGLLSLFA